MTDSGERPDSDPVYRAVLIVLVASVMAGALLAVAGEYHFDSPAMRQVGVGATVVSGAIYFLFRWLGKRARRRRAPDLDNKN